MQIPAEVRVQDLSYDTSSTTVKIFTIAVIKRNLEEFKMSEYITAFYSKNLQELKMSAYINIFYSNDMSFFPAMTLKSSLR